MHGRILSIPSDPALEVSSFSFYLSVLQFVQLLSVVLGLKLRDNRAMQIKENQCTATCDFQQCGILTSVDSD